MGPATARHDPTPPGPPARSDVARWCRDLSAPPGAVADVGQKAWTLARLTAAGLPVPAGFSVSAAALALHLAQRHGDSTLEDAVGAVVARAMGPEDLEAAAAAIHDLITGAPVPSPLVDELLACRRRLPGTVIVRSSAVGEDGVDASFAGQLDSIADVEDDDDEGLLRAIRRCWASAWSARALFYQAARGRTLRGVGVVVQAQVQARVSGVLFTVAPGQPARMRAEFCAGPGEALVSGRVAPGVIEADRDVGGAEGAGVITAWPEQPGPAPSFDPTIVVALGRRVEALQGGVPQDIEWCIDHDGAMFVVQTRPITTLSTTSGPDPDAPIRRPVRFSNANVNENFPTPISPLLYSIARKGYAAYFGTLGRVMGLDEDRIAAATPALSSIVGAHGARLYYNLSSLHGCLRVAPFGDWLTASFNVFVGVEGGAAESSTLWTPKGVLAESQAALAFVARGTWALATASARLPTFERDVDDFAAAAHPTQLPHLDDAGLERLVRRFLEIREQRWGPAALGDVSAMIGYGALRSVLSRVLPDAEETLQNDLLKGLADVVSGIPTQRLWELSRLKRDGDPRFDTELAWFLEAWGFRRSGELLLTTPTLQDDPTPVLSLIAQLATMDGPSPEAHTATHAREREARTDAVLRALPLPMRPALRALLRFTRTGIGLRERARLKQALLYTRLGPVIRELGARLHGRGALERADDVFLLTVDELLDHLAGVSMFGAFLGEICAHRRALHARLTQDTPPDAFTIERGTYRSPATSSASSSPSSASEAAAMTLTGAPAAAGQATGRAAVLRDVQEAARMTRGDILVTKQTDPGWGPVLFLARALVIERGGMLSHGAIIAREFGVPCVVGVPDASRRIIHGTPLHVDGTRGVVTLVEPAPGAPS